MRTIRKEAEPASLTQHRASGGSYDGYAGKETLRDSLVREQRGLCCYCLSRIPAKHGMKIEHWHSQAQNRNEQLDYGNLLGACTGNEGQPWKNQHCDTRKGNHDLSYNPANPLHRVETRLRYQGDGQIVSEEPGFDSEINSVLNLNHAFLKNNRKETLHALQQAMGEGALTGATIERWLREWNGESDTGQLRPFCQVVVYWLRKRLARA